MTIKEMQEVLDASFLYGEELADLDVQFVFSADMMSDVLAYGGKCSVLITGLCAQPRCLISSVLFLFVGRCRTRICWRWPWERGWRYLPPTTICSPHAACSMNMDFGEVLDDR